MELFHKSLPPFYSLGIFVCFSERGGGQWKTPPDLESMYFPLQELKTRNCSNIHSPLNSYNIFKSRPSWCSVHSCLFETVIVWPQPPLYQNN